MFLFVNNRYSLLKLASINIFSSLFSDSIGVKNTFKINGDCWFEFYSFESGFGLCDYITIQVFSEKKELHKKLKDYERAFIFLKKNQYVGHVSMEIDEDLNCFITFTN